MKKRRIVLASILKPVNDTRMFEKMGVPLAQSGRYEVHIIGYPTESAISDPNVHFHPLPKFKRLSFARFTARLKVLKFIIKVKPELLIVTTHELLEVAILIRIFFGTKIIYDIQENYWKNILYTDAFPKIIRPLIASFVRLKEWITSPFFSQFLLAEKCYAYELSFVKSYFVTIENKCKVPHDFHRNPNKEFIELIFTGTIAESTGVFQAIDLAKKLHAVEPKIRLKIVGYCARTNELQKIKDEVSENSFITLTGGDKLVPHSLIMDTIATANFGIIYYPQSPHTENKIPTKLYEYLACQLPILLQNHKPWVETANPFDAAIAVNYEQPDIESILKQISNRSFYSKIPPQLREDTNQSNSNGFDSLTWQNEEKKLLGLINNIF
ncbi:MAG TPA: glycosyltransferase [Cyclobacteriaceae bacterium]|nr:glycosyltransferase [Cyclobacteriaceae bacterium]